MLKMAKRAWMAGVISLAAAVMLVVMMGFSGTGMIVAMKSGDFVIRYFGGTTAGRDSAYTYATPNGLVSMGPGTEGLGFGSIPQGVSVVRQSYLGWEMAGRPFKVSPVGTNRFLVDSTGTRVLGKETIDDSLRVKKKGIFDQGVNVTGASWISGTAQVTDTLTLNKGVKMGSNTRLYENVFGDLVLVNYGDVLSIISYKGGATNTITFQVDNTIAGVISEVGKWTLKQAAVTDSFRTDGGLYIGGQFIKKHLTATAGLNFADFSGATCQDYTISVPGAALGDVVSIGVPNAAAIGSSIYWAWVSSANTVTVRGCDWTAVGDPPLGTFRVDVWQH